MELSMALRYLLTIELVVILCLVYVYQEWMGYTDTLVLQEMLQKGLVPTNGQSVAARSLEPHSNSSIEDEMVPMAAVIIPATDLLPMASSDRLSAKHIERLLFGYSLALAVGAPWVVLSGTDAECEEAAEYLHNLRLPANGFLSRKFMKQFPLSVQAAQLVNEMRWTSLAAWRSAAIPIDAFRSTVVDDAESGSGSILSAQLRRVAAYVSAGVKQTSSSDASQGDMLHELRNAKQQPRQWSGTTQDGDQVELLLPGIVTVSTDELEEEAAFLTAASIQSMIVSSVRARFAGGGDKCGNSDHGNDCWWLLNRTYGVIVVPKDSEMPKYIQKLYHNAFWKASEDVYEALETEIKSMHSFLHRHAAGHSTSRSPPDTAAGNMSNAQVFVVPPIPSFIGNRYQWQPLSAVAFPADTPKGVSWAARWSGRLSQHIYLNYRVAMDSITAVPSPQGDAALYSIVQGLHDGYLQWHDLVRG